MAEGFNPIQDVDGAAIPCPTSFRVTLTDVSAEGAGRTEAGYMNKNRIGQAVSIDLGWNYPTISEMAQLMQAFDAEYIYVTYLDPKKGGFIKKEFYVGDRSAPIFNTALGKWESLTLTIIMRNGGEVI